MKTDPDDFAVGDFARHPKKTTAWTGVRNFQARNYMQEMARGDLALLYHSSCPEPGIVGVMSIASARAYADPTQFDQASKYHEPAATPEKPRWFLVDVKLERKTKLVPLEALRAVPALAEMMILRKGNRLSVTPVTDKEWKALEKILK